MNYKAEAKEIINRINLERWSGYDGWRIPGEYEWSTVIDKRYKKPVLVKGFDIGDIVYKFPYWIRREDKESEDCIQLDGALLCLPPKNGIFLENGVFPYLSRDSNGMILPVRTHDRLNHEKILSFYQNRILTKKNGPR